MVLLQWCCHFYMRRALAVCWSLRWESWFLLPANSNCLESIIPAVWTRSCWIICRLLSLLLVSRLSIYLRGKSVLLFQSILIYMCDPAVLNAEIHYIKFSPEYFLYSSVFFHVISSRLLFFTTPLIYFCYSEINLLSPGLSCTRLRVVACVEELCLLLSISYRLHCENLLP